MVSALETCDFCNMWGNVHFFFMSGSHTVTETNRL